MTNLLQQFVKLSLLSRYQPRAGPDGGDGGRGGSIVLIADNSVKEFGHLPKHIKAENGGNGRGDDCKGKNGSDRTFQVNMQSYFCLFNPFAPQYKTVILCIGIARMLAVTMYNLYFYKSYSYLHVACKVSCNTNDKKSNEDYCQA